MTAATFGDLLAQARGHLDAAGDLAGPPLRRESVLAVAKVTGRAARTLSHYLHDIAPYSVAEAITSSDFNAPVRAAVDAREAAQMAAATLRAGYQDHDIPADQPPDPLVAHLAAAADSLAAGRDLLRSHFVTGPDGSPQRWDWAAVITSAPVARALLAEVARCTRQLAFLTDWLSLLAARDPAVPEPVHQGLAGASRWLLTGCTAIAAGQRHDPATAADAELMRAIPASLPPGRQPPPLHIETPGELAAGIAVSAARLRVIAQAAAPEDAAWSTALTAESWQWKATGAAVICHLSQLMLTSLTDHPGLATATPEAAPQLSAAASAVADACARWREVAAAWSQMTTEARGLTAPGVADTGDLLVRLGRLAFTDPEWTPDRSRSAPLRHQVDLAPDPAQAGVVAGALHHVADTLGRTGAADLRAVDFAVRASRIYAPTRTLPEYYNVPYKYGHATPADTAALLDAYHEACSATDRAVTDLDALAVTMNAPTRVLAAARAAIRAARDPGTAPEADPPVQPVQRPAVRTPRTRHQPGLVEKAIGALGGSPDLVLLMRARAIDRLADKLIAEAKQPSQDVATPGPAHAHGPPARLARNPARVAAENFPQPPPGTSMAHRQASGIPQRSRTLPAVGGTKAADATAEIRRRAAKP